MTDRPRIAFLSQNCFVQCDVGIVPDLARDCDVTWTVFTPCDERTGYDDQLLRDMGGDWGVPTVVHRLENRLRSPLAILEYVKLVRDIRRRRPHLVYVNATGHPWLAFVVKAMLGSSKVLWAVHDVEEHEDSLLLRISALYKKCLYRMMRNFHVLSPNQGRLLQRIVPTKRCFHAPHSPLDYGPTTAVAAVAGKTRFLFFGNIRHYKGLDLLIDAAQILHDRGGRDFEVAISGSTPDWPALQKRIRIPGIFKLDIRMVPNEDVPDLFGSSHWIVLPYRHVTQSGPMAIAFNYRIPSIVSDLEAFSDFVVPGRTGLDFRSEDASSLADALERALNLGPAGYGAIRANLLEIVDERFGMEACRRSYRTMFRDCARAEGRSDLDVLV